MGGRKLGPGGRCRLTEGQILVSSVLSNLLFRALAQLPCIEYGFVIGGWQDQQ